MMLEKKTFRVPRLVRVASGIVVVAALLASCTPDVIPETPQATSTSLAPSPEPADTSPQPTPTSQPAPIPTGTSVPEPTNPPQPSPTMATAPAEIPPEAIEISQPGPGSRVVGQIQLTGMADPTFEQSLAVTVVLADGTELLTVPVQIQSELGQRGPFEVDIAFTVQEEQPAFIQVYSSSARDGGLTHLSSVTVTLANDGEPDIRPAGSQEERINIFQPSPNSTVTGGSVHVEGFALAGFEQTLLVELVGPEGAVIASQPVIVQAPDLGQPGPFSVDIPYPATVTGPGRLVVRDVSPAFGGNVHLSSVEVTLQ